MKKKNEMKHYTWTDHPYPDWWEDQKNVYGPMLLVAYEIIDPWCKNQVNNWYSGFDKESHRDIDMNYRTARLHEVLWMAHKDGFMIGEGWGMPLAELDADD